MTKPLIRERVREVKHDFGAASQPRNEESDKAYDGQEMEHEKT